MSTLPKLSLSRRVSPLHEPANVIRPMRFDRLCPHEENRISRAREKERKRAATTRSYTYKVRANIKRILMNIGNFFFFFSFFQRRTDSDATQTKRVQILRNERKRIIINSVEYRRDSHPRVTICIHGCARARARALYFYYVHFAETR